MYYRKENDINIKISNTEFTFIEPVLPEELNLNKEEILEFNKLKTYHMHTAYEIFFIEDSPITIVTPDGKSEFVNSIVILPPYYNHYTLNITQPKALLFNINNRENIKDEFNFLFESKVKNTAISVPINENISFYANQIFKNKGLENNKSKLQSLYNLIFLEILDSLSQKSNKFITQKSKKSHNYEAIINGILTYDFNNDVNLEYLSKKLHLSTKQVSRILKNKFGKTLSELLLERRLSVASIYLVQTKIKISKIIELTGFNTENYFFSQFKKKFHITPTAYRNKYQKK